MYSMLELSPEIMHTLYVGTYCISYTNSNMAARKHACLVSDHNVENVFFRKSGGGDPLPTCINNEKYSVHEVCTCRSKEQRICFHMFCFFPMCAMFVFSYCRSFQV
jgi:hypothetical protein